MMKEHLMHGIARTMMDGVKDAKMQLEYAEEAKEHGDHELAAHHLEEAHNRLAGAKAWHERARKHIDGHSDPFIKVFDEEWCEWYHDVERELSAFKAM